MPDDDAVNNDHIIVTGGGDLVQLLEVDKTGKQCEFLLLETGLSKNKFNYSAAVLKEAVPLFNGVYAFADHTNEDEQAVRPERSVKDKVGRWTNVHYGQATINGRLTEGIRGTLKVLAPWLRDVIKESVEMGEPDFIGVSVDARGDAPKLPGKTIREVKSIAKVYSVDVVTAPSAGGHLMRLVASDPGDERRPGLPEENEPSGAGTSTAVVAAPAAPAAPTVTLTTAQLADIVREQVSQVLQEATRPIVEATQAQQTELAALRESQRVAVQRERFEAAITAAEGISAAGQDRLRHSFADTASRRDLTDEEMLNAIRETASYEGSLIQSMLGSPRGTAREGATLGSEQADKYALALVGMFENEAQKDKDGKTVPAFRSIKEAYCRWTGRDSFEVDPYEIMDAFGCKYDSAKHHVKIQESVSRASWGEIYADVFYLQLIKSYRASPVYDKWKMIVSEIENVPDFQTRHWSRVGGYADLDTVPESATYPQLVTPTDEEVTYAVSKKGGLEDITFEAITNDRVGAIRRVPASMARAAIRTLFKFVMSLATTTNANMDYDGVALYHASHGNTGTTALSLTGLTSVVAAMRAATAYSETLEILGERNKPKVLIVPGALEFVAQRLINPSDAYLAAIAAPGTEQSLDPQAFKGYGLSYIVYDQLTDATDWWAVADPAEVETIVMGFLNGRQDPEMFVQDQPNVGSNFTADKTTYKVRHIYGGDVIDHRSFYRQVVAG